MVFYFIKNNVKYIIWGIYGVSISNPLMPQRVKSILFVCKGNICRSNFAEMLAENKYNTLKEYSFTSAGIRVDQPINPPEEAVVAAQRYGVDIRNKKSMQLNYYMMESSDLIVVMETWHFNYLRKLFLEYRDKIFLLPLLESKDFGLRGKYSQYNIRDPYGKSALEFIECYNRIDTCIEKLFLLINKHRKEMVSN